MAAFNATTTSAKIVDENTNRRDLYIQNYGAGTIHLGIDTPATTDSGPRLYPGDSINRRGLQAASAIHAITTAGTASGTYEEA